MVSAHSCQLTPQGAEVGELVGVKYIRLDIGGRVEEMLIFRWRMHLLLCALSLLRHCALSPCCLLQSVILKGAGTGWLSATHMNPPPHHVAAPPLHTISGNPLIITTQH